MHLNIIHHEVEKLIVNWKNNSVYGEVQNEGQEVLSDI